MKRILSWILTCACLLALCGGLFGCAGMGKQKFTDYSFDYFDTATTIIGYEKNEQAFAENMVWIKGLLREYHRLYDIYTQYKGLTNLASINARTAGDGPVTVDQRVIDLLLFAKEMYQETDGRVNIAMGSVLRIWHSYRKAGAKDPANATLPPMSQLEEASLYTNLDSVIIDDEHNTVHLTDPNLYLDVGAIAKGYAIERIAQEMEARGISGYLLNVGGNIRTVGAKPDGSLWEAGIQNPDTQADLPHIAYLRLEQISLVTSGVYQRYYVVDGKRYHHIIDPDTLMPGENYLSVSVLTPHSGRADALSTALFLMSPEAGLALIESLPDTEAQWVLPDGTILTSSGFTSHTYTP